MLSMGHDGPTAAVWKRWRRALKRRMALNALIGYVCLAHLQLSTYPYVRMGYSVAVRVRERATRGKALHRLQGAVDAAKASVPSPARFACQPHNAAAGCTLTNSRHPSAKHFSSEVSERVLACNNAARPPSGTCSHCGDCGWPRNAVWFWPAVGVLGSAGRSRCRELRKSG